MECLLSVCVLFKLIHCTTSMQLVSYNSLVPTGQIKFKSTGSYSTTSMKIVL